MIPRWLLPPYSALELTLLAAAGVALVAVVWQIRSLIAGEPMRVGKKRR